MLRKTVGGDDPINGNKNRMNTSTNGDDEDVRKLNPYLIDPPGTALHVGGGAALIGALRFLKSRCRLRDQTRTLGAQSHHVRFAPMTGHRQRGRVRQKSARSRPTDTEKHKGYGNVTVSQLSPFEGLIDDPLAF